MCPAIDRRNVLWNEIFLQVHKDELKEKGSIYFEYMSNKSILVRYDYVIDSLKNCDILNTVKKGDIKIDYKMILLYGSKDDVSLPEIGKRFINILDNQMVDFVTCPGAGHQLKGIRGWEYVDNCFDKINDYVLSKITEYTKNNN